MLYTVVVTEMRFVRRVQWAADVWEYFWQPDTAVVYQAGQYANFYVADVDDPRGNTRIFTLTSLPSDEFISFAVKISAVPSPYKKHLVSLKPGDTVHMSETMGDMVLPRLSTTPLTLVAGGLGIASYISLLRKCDESKLSHPINLLWAIRSGTDRYELPIEFASSSVKYQEFTAPKRLSADDIIAATPTNGLIYLSGSERFVMTLRHDLHAREVTDTQLLFDYFSGYNEL